ncbi:MAG: hypothetical protein AAFR38_00365 [Planctomycetota bacterium]
MTEHHPPAITPPPFKPAGGPGATRETFWQNVMREILSALAATAAASGGRLSATASGAAQGGSPESELFDGRLAIITRLGQRIPIADIVPVFSCGIGNEQPTADDQKTIERHKMLANDVTCTVFQIRTPGGEVYTLPLHEIASFHALSDQLIERLNLAAQQQQAMQQQMQRAHQPAATPFGFAAFTSLADAEDQQNAGDGTA